MLFATALSESSRSLVVNKELITKVYFPRLAVPLSTILAALVDFAIGSTVLIGMMIFYGVVPGWPLLALPLFLGLTVLTALAVGTWLSALNVQYRDVEYVIPFLTLLWMFATPVAYSINAFPEQLRSIVGINPLAGVVEGFRWSLFQKTAAPGVDDFDLRRSAGAAARQRPLLLPPNRADVRRCHLATRSRPRASARSTSLASASGTRRCVTRLRRG